MMPTHCTCGTLLVENARFCHRCGRPTTEPVAEEALVEDVVVTRTQTAPPPIPGGTPEEPIPVSFSNPIAIRVAFSVALLVMVGYLLVALIVSAIQITQMADLLIVGCSAGGGWFAVRFYRRLTGFRMSISSGAKLGGITGLLAFLALFVLLTIAVALAGQQEFFRQLTSQSPEVGQLLSTPEARAGFLFSVALMGFVIVTGSCAAGGALGARFSGQSRPSNS